MENEKNQSDNPELDDLGHSQAVKAALHLTVGQISKNVGNEYGLTFSKPAVATLAELINRQIEVYAIDLEAFAKHARRTLIGMDDVKLLARRNRSLKETISGFIDEVEASGSSVPRKAKRRKKENERRKSETKKEESKVETKTEEIRAEKSDPPEVINLD
ncbi:Centromere protein S [Armadillidium vulgare]|nr:Centromere protein S [Armadillidium vulgare]